MLTADLVRARRRGDRLFLLKFEGETRARAAALARRYIQLAAACVGLTREVLDRGFAAIPVPGRDRRLAAGLQKLVKDRCAFSVEAGASPAELRQEVFVRANAVRRGLAAGESFERDAILEEVASERALEPTELERLLYADLRSAHQLNAFEPIGPEQLLEVYELSQAQAVLLRALRVTADVTCRSPGTFRRLFHKLKFLRLLFTIEDRDDGGYRIVIDGPHSLFSSVTKYGLQLALVLPALRECDAMSLEADVLWGKDRRPLVFSLTGGSGDGGDGDPGGPARLPDGVAKLLDRFEDDASWQAAPCAEVLPLPGVGLCVPDLVFRRQTDGARVYLEVLGYWSREAVWKRVELVERGLPYRILFAVSSRLRVSEAALGDDLPGALYVFKGVMNAREVTARLELLASRK